MTIEKELERLQDELRRVAARSDDATRAAAEVRSMVDHLIDLLAAKNLLNDRQRKLVVDLAGREVRAERPKVRLALFVDKYQVPSGDIDCAARMHLCGGRCCALRFALSQQDLDEGGVHWQYDEPYLIKQERDGYCAHLERASCGCQIYARRPAPCRSFDCRDDARVWIDFEKRIPAPMPEGLRAPPGAQPR